MYSTAEIAALRGATVAALGRLPTKAAGAALGVNHSYAPGASQGARNGRPDPANPYRVAQVMGASRHCTARLAAGCPRMTVLLGRGRSMTSTRWMGPWRRTCGARGSATLCASCLGRISTLIRSPPSRSRQSSAGRVAAVRHPPPRDSVGLGARHGKPLPLTVTSAADNFHQDVCDYGGGGDTNGAATTYRYGGLTNFGNLCVISLTPGGPSHQPH